MWCPHCGTDTRVLETDKLSKTVTRVRWCRNGDCRFLFETQEVVSGAVVREEPFGLSRQALRDTGKAPGARARGMDKPGK